MLDMVVLSLLVAWVFWLRDGTGHRARRRSLHPVLPGEEGTLAKNSFRWVAPCRPRGLGERSRSLQAPSSAPSESLRRPQEPLFVANRTARRSRKSPGHRAPGPCAARKHPRRPRGRVGKRPSRSLAVAGGSLAPVQIGVLVGSLAAVQSVLGVLAGSLARRRERADTRVVVVTPCSLWHCDARAESRAPSERTGGPRLALFSR